MSKKAFESLSYGIYIASSTFEGKDAGCVINSFQQATSAFPQKFLITLNKYNFTREVVEKSGLVTVSVLAKDTPKDLINEFGFKSSRVIDKFAKFETERDSSGILYLVAPTISVLSLKVIGQMDLGSHIAFATELTDSKILREAEPLTAAYYKDLMNGKAAPNAPIFRTLETSYRCSVCGYVYKSDTLPPDYHCPLCGAPAEKFVKI